MIHEPGGSWVSSAVAAAFFGFAGIANGKSDDDEEDD
jgi:hypothetical protein